MHDLLVAAARRSAPFERLETLISGLADRVETLAASAPHDAARRIDAAMQHSRAVAERAEASLSRLDSKLEAAGAESLAELMRGLSARLDAAELRGRERPPIEPVLAEILEKLERDRPQDAGALETIDRELAALRAAIERNPPAPVERIADALTQKLEGRFADQSLLATIPERFARLDDRLASLSVHSRDVEALEGAARDLMEELRGRGPADANADVAEQVSALRRETADAERRTEALLQGMQEVLNRLIDRLPAGDGELSRSGGRQSPGEQQGFNARAAGATALAALRDVPPRPSRTRLDAAAGPESAAPSLDPDDEFLLEPGAGAPQRLQAGDAAAALGSRTNPAVSAHIAAARRATQPAVAEVSEPNPSATWPDVERNMRRARRFTVEHKRPLLLAAALLLAVAAAAGLVGHYGLSAQKSALEGPVSATSTPVAPAAVRGAAAAGAPPSVDVTPTGSIARDRGALENRSERQPPPDLSTAIPSGVPAALREAVLAGSAPAQYELAQRLFEGRELPQDQRAAAFWFERAAKAGFAPAEFRLGALYQKGVGVERDPIAAKRWYAAAARAGNARAAHNLGVMDAEAVGGGADYAEAARWFRRAAELGVRDSQFNLAVLYARGLGVEQDLRKSWMWFSLAAAQGDAEAGRKRDEVAAKMDPDGLAAAGDLLSKFKATAPDPAANDVAATFRDPGDPVQPAPASAPPRPADGPRSGS